MLKILITIFAIYLIFKYIVAPILRVFLQKTIKKVVEREMGQFGGASKPPRKEGSIKVDYVPDGKSTKASSKEGEGEYIDYEEVK